jgi:fumarate reductase iron-sulfur subunit
MLACAIKVEDGDLIEPLRAHNVIRDLKVNKSAKLDTIKREKAYLKEYKEVALSPKDEELTAIQSDCILCDSCYSACPVFEVNKEFLGPFALTRAYRYAVDKRLQEPKEIIESIQQNGVWDCTLCGECTLVCPKGIDPKADIIQLRNLSAQNGYMDPNLTAGFNGGGFGFNPNGF